MTRDRIALLAGAALAVGIAIYVARKPASPAVAPDPSASTTAPASASAAPAISLAAASATPSAARVGEAVPGAKPDDEIAVGVGHGGVDGGADAAVVTIDETHAGTTVRLARGQKLVVALRANPSTGFDWAVLKAPPALGKPEMGSVAAAGEGAGGQRRLTFSPEVALPPGEHAVELGYQRSFEDGGAPMKTFRFTVRVAD